MGRTKKFAVNMSFTPRKIRQYSSETFQKGLDAIMAGAGLSKTAKWFGLPKSTLGKRQSEIQIKLKEWADTNPLTEKQLDSETAQLLNKKSCLKSNKKIKRKQFSKTTKLEKTFGEDKTFKTETIEENISDKNSHLVHRVEKVCSTCFTESPGSLEPADPSIRNLFMVYLTKEILDELDITKLQICETCSKKLKDVKLFLDSCLNSLQSFKSILAQTYHPSGDQNSIKAELDDDDTFNDNNRLHETSHKEAESSSDEEKEISTPGTIQLDLSSTESGFCSLCNQFYLGSDHSHLLEHHIYETKDNSALICSECNQIFSKESRLLRHLNDEHIRFQFPIKCPHCDFLAIFKKTLTVHIEHHAKDYVCDFCNGYFQQKVSLIKHMTENHMLERPCPVCNQSVMVGKEFEQHLTDHKNDKHICEVCGKSYKTDMILFMHKRQAW